MAHMIILLDNNSFTVIPFRSTPISYNTFGFAFYTKRSDKEFSLFRQFKIFFGYLFGGIALIMFVFSVISTSKKTTFYLKILIL